MKRFLVGLTFLLGLLTAQDALAAFSYRTPRVVQTGQVPSTQTNFPALVLLNDTRYKSTGNGGHVTSTSGYDIRFASDAACTSLYTYELVPGTYSASGGTGEFWVLIPSLADALTIQICYGDSSITTDGSSTSTWRSEYKLVSHLPNGSTLTSLDSTVNANNLTNTSATATTGKIDGAAALNGSTAFLSKTTTSSLNITGTAMSGLAWINPTSFGGGSRGRIFDHGNYIWYVDNSNITAGMTFTADVGTNFGAVTNNSSISTGSLQHIAFTYDGTNVRFYVNATAVGAPAYSTSIPSATNTLYVGDNGALTRNFDGIIDDLRLYSGMLTANWITTSFNNETNNATFWPDGTEVVIGVFNRRTADSPRVGTRSVQ